MVMLQAPDNKPALIQPAAISNVRVAQFLP
jgi:hypothetical protein